MVSDYQSLTLHYCEFYHFVLLVTRLENRMRECEAEKSTVRKTQRAKRKAKRKCKRKERHTQNASESAKRKTVPFSASITLMTRQSSPA